MADWTSIPDTTFEPGAPAKGRDMRFLRDNPIAIAEGASGAPRIANAAFSNGTLGSEKLQSGAAERDWVLARIASASLGALGTYATLYSDSNTNPGAIVMGSSLNYVAGMTSYSHIGQNSTGSVTAGLGSSPPGTWRCMSNLSFDATESQTAAFRAGLWLRIS